MYPLTTVFSGHETMHLMKFLLKAPDDGPFIALRERDGVLFSISRSNGQWTVEDGEGFDAITRRGKPQSSREGGASPPETPAPSALAVCYQYRDADNYKQQNTIEICPAPAGRDLILVLTALLADSEGFVPSEIGMTDIQHMMASEPDFDECDHTYHEVVTLTWSETPSQKAIERAPASEIIRLARAWIEGGRTWDHAAAIERIEKNT